MHFAVNVDRGIVGKRLDIHDILRQKPQRHTTGFRPQTPRRLSESPAVFLPTVPRIYTFHADTGLIRIGTLPDAKSNVSLQSLCQLYYKILLYFCQ